MDGNGLGFDISPEYEQVIQERVTIDITKSLFDMAKDEED
jgi:hypothetical protein